MAYTKEQRKEHDKQYHQTPAGKETKKKSNALRRRLDFIPLNNYFEGSEAHHMNREFVAYIPKEIHRSVYHCLETRQGMAEINMLAFKYLLNSI